MQCIYLHNLKRVKNYAIQAGKAKKSDIKKLLVLLYLISYNPTLNEGTCLTDTILAYDISEVKIIKLTD